MPDDFRPSDRRAFGRRGSSLNGLAHIAGRAPEPCLVHNFSDGGARVEFNGGVEPPAQFRLIIAAKDFETECEVRHRSGNVVGVLFTGPGVGRDLGDRAQTRGIGERHAIGPDMVRPSETRRVVTVVSGDDMRRKLFGGA